MLTFFVFLAGYTLSQFFRSFLAVIAPELSADLHLTAAGLGNISAAWFVAFALAQFAVGAALDRIGPRRTTSLLMMAGVVGALLFSRAQSSSDAIVAMSLIGVGCSPSLMGPLYLFARNSSTERFAVLSSMIIGFGTIGNLMGGTPLALAVEAIGWRSVFVCLSGVALLAALLIGLLVEDMPTSQKAARTEVGGTQAGLRDVLTLKSLWPVWPLMAVSYGILITERGVWVGPYLAEVHQLSTIERGHTIFIMASAIAAGALVYGPLESRLGRRKDLVLAGSLVAAAAMLALSQMAQGQIYVVTSLLSIFGFAGMTFGPLMAHIRTFLPEPILGRGMTFANFLCMTGAAMLQRWSGSKVDALKAAGESPSEVYSSIHLAFGSILLIASLIYAFSREQRAASLR